LEWAEKPGIKAVVFMLEGNADPRIIKLLERMGFTEKMPVLVKWR